MAASTAEVEYLLTGTSAAKPGYSASSVKWLVASGSQVREDQVIAELTLSRDTMDAASLSRPIVQQFRAPVSGKLVALVANGRLTTAADAKLAAIRVCTHSMLYKGSLCAVCGNDVRLLPRATKAFLEKHASVSALISPTNASRTSTAPGSSSGPDAKSSGAGAGAFGAANMRTVRAQHGYELQVSHSHVAAVDAFATARLQASRKLTLLLDLDHTLVHATYAPEAAAAAAHPSFSNDVGTFSDGYATFHVKLRPWVREFLLAAAAICELQVDTAGTRAYAERVVALLDPSGKLFGSRVVSRCDSELGKERRKESTSWAHRTLADDSMTLIVDDTQAVWRGARNVIVIEPYRFWAVSAGFCYCIEGTD